MGMGSGQLGDDTGETPEIPDEDEEPENPEYYEGWNNHEQVDDRMP